MLTFSTIRPNALPESMRTKWPYQLRGEYVLAGYWS